MSQSDLPILHQRRIEAAILKPVYDEMVARLGVEAARSILGAAVKSHAIAQGQAYASTADNTSLTAFHALLEQWKADGALEIEMLREDDDAVEYNVTRCRYAETYKDMGLGDLGPLLSCNRDGTFCQGFDPRIKLTRTQTIMQGASHCDFRYRWEPDGAEQGGAAQGGTVPNGAGSGGAHTDKNS